MDAARLKEDVQHATRAMQDKIAEGIGRVQERMESGLRQRGDQSRSALTSLNEQFGSFVQESPILAIGGAFAVGYMIAKMARAFK
jgi:ElaB/YqjD/DUF883 family membrane-anchored ribosome-binding protein